VCRRGQRCRATPHRPALYYSTDHNTSDEQSAGDRATQLHAAIRGTAAPHSAHGYAADKQSADDDSAQQEPTDDHSAGHESTDDQSTDDHSAGRHFGASRCWDGPAFIFGKGAGPSL
jgi:hypothetical protein